MRNLNRLSIALVATFSLLLTPFNSSAQNVGINETGATPDESALLDLSSDDNGFLITRADTANIASPAFGLMTLAPIDSCLYMFSGASWMSLGGVGNNCGSASGGTGGTGGSSFNCGDPLTDTRDSETYGTVEIGNQCWMSENLNYTPSSGNSWCYNNAPAQCNTYGRLYDWNTASNTTSSSTNPSGVQGVCPTGWHLPSDAEWKELEMELGMSQTEADGTGFRGTNEGNQLKTSSWGGINSSGFTALPGGLRNTTGSFSFESSFGYWWSATESGADAWWRLLGSSQSAVHRNANGKGGGHSVRCVRN